MSKKILLNDHEFPIKVSYDISIAHLVSTLDRVLMKQNKRIGKIYGDGKDIFNPSDFLKRYSDFDTIKCRSRRMRKKTKKGVVTLSIGEKYREMYDISRPFIKQYSEKIDADFIEINTVKINMPPVHFEKWQMFDLLFKYDRLIFLDADILIKPDCPDLTGIVPIDEVGAYVESEHSDRRAFIDYTQSVMGNIGWETEYVNSGIGVFSYIHRPIFQKTNKYVIGPAGDQNMFNFRIKQLGFKIFPLDKNFNRMDMHGIEDRFFAYIIHYAGPGYTKILEKNEKRYAAKIELMKRDSARLNS